MKKLPALITLLMLSSPVFAATLSLDDYLHEVDESNVNIRSAREASAGAEARTVEAKLITLPRFFADATWVNEHKTNPLFSFYRAYREDLFDVGIQEQTSFGLTGRFTYTLLNADYVGFRPRFWEGQPKLELSQSLWRNFLGSEIQAQVEATEASARATRYAQSFQAKRIRAEAETTYIRVAAAQDLVNLHEKSMKWAQELLGWAQRRSRLNLGEDTDYFQAQANHQARKLLLESAKNELRTASRAFNRLRNVDADELKEDLTLPELKSLKSPSRARMRDDVQAAIEQTRAASASARLGAERNRPTLEIFGQYAMNSRAPDEGSAFRDSFQNDTPSIGYGLRFSTPLAFGKMNDTIEGYRRESAAAERLKDQKLFEQDIEWKDLVQKFEEAKRRYEIASDLAEIQQKKARSERVRLNRGRTTTYQALTFELDFTQAELARIQAQSEVLSLLAQMKLFGNT